MCLILFASRVHARYPLIVAANRDESYERPSAPVSFWSDHPHVCAGRDLEHGGTWLGIATNGRFAAVTNYRQRPRAAPAKRSRGELTRDYLVGSEPVAAYVESVARRAYEYRGFSLIAGKPGRLFFYSNRGNGAQAVAPGVHGLSNHLLDEPWPKVERGIAVLSGLVRAEESEITATLFELLADQAPAPDELLPSTGIGLERERAVSAAFIAGETYGTRASTVLLVNAAGEALFREHSYGARGILIGTNEQHFQLELTALAPSHAEA
jgi:uncharacterized protein with NRDE domain